MRKTRVTVTIRQRVGDYEVYDNGGYTTEWVHDEDFGAYTPDELGVRLDWSGGARTFVPWHSVIRVDYAPCNCMECQQ